VRPGPRLLLVVWLAVVWCALWGEASVGNIVAGVVIGTVLVLLFHPDPDRGGRRDPVAIVRFGIYFAWALIVSNVTVARQVLFPRDSVDLAIVAVPLRARSPLIVSLVANAITLTPGTMTIEVAPSISEDEEEATRAPVVLFVHCLDGSDPESIRAEGLNLEEMAVRGFGTAADREAILGPAPTWPTGPIRQTHPRGSGA
jgi:multicomponent Na+:H+ antiporter subunit E